MVAIQHLARYIKTHPDAFMNCGDTILRSAEARARDCILTSEQVRELLTADRADKLFTLIETDEEYIKISMESTAAFVQARGS